MQRRWRATTALRDGHSICASVRLPCSVLACCHFGVANSTFDCVDVPLISVVAIYGFARNV